MSDLSHTDLQTIEKRGISPEKLRLQLAQLASGFPFMRIDAPATLARGIKAPDDDMQNLAISLWDQFLKAGGKVVKFVPASGAASRMFKNLFSFLNGKSAKPDNDFIRLFFDNIARFAFFPALNLTCVKLYGKSIDSLVKEQRYKDVVAALLNKEGLNYGALPKAMLMFHKLLGATRTPVEEHLAEGAQYAASDKGRVMVHFTVSEEHLPLFHDKIEEVAAVVAGRYGVQFDISLSVQKPSTDTVAALKNGQPYREEGELFFRPGGHGALIENLNDLDADVVFIKNIDNVVPDHLRAVSNRFKKIAGGVLVGAKQKADEYCRLLEKGCSDEEKLSEMLAFLREVLCITHDSCDSMTPAQKADYIFSKLNRPMRVCGMVKNEGEPGGGPFLAYNPDGTVSPQILESVQLNASDKEIKKIIEQSTHFNPVDLVCAIRDYKGHKFNLPDYVDPATGFISEKSRNGVEIKALELPGLWNGAMSDWSTIFLEVPIDTFNPVKTVNDFLRPAHQPESL